MANDSSRRLLPSLTGKAIVVVDTFCPIDNGI